jgi:hypothetical protein
VIEWKVRTATTVSKPFIMQVFDGELTKIKDQRVLGIGAVVVRYLGERSVMITRQCASSYEP